MWKHVKDTLSTEPVCCHLEEIRFWCCFCGVLSCPRRPRVLGLGELNFPIGQRDPIDLAGQRWELPIHLIEALFAVQTSSFADRAWPGTNYYMVLLTIHPQYSLQKSKTR